MTFVLYKCIITIVNKTIKQKSSYKGGNNYLIELIELNKVYKMDNLELLNQLPNNYIDLIYSDILFNTGKKFKDYNDNLGTPQQAIEWYRPRIEEMYRVLKDTGSIYLHMDYRLVHYMKVLMDEIFGFDNFRNEIVWQKTYTSKTQSKSFGKVYDTILFYSKNNKFTYNQLYLSPNEDYINKYYNKIDDDGNRFQSISLTQQGQGNAKYFGNKLIEPPSGMHWIWKQERIDKAMENGLIYFTKNNMPRLKKYYDKDTTKGKPLHDLWVDEEIAPLNSWHSKSVNYDTQKPKSLLERIIKSSSNGNDIVADLFMGSGTTMVVAKELGRNFIGCDISERAIEITEKRLSEVCECDDVG